MLDRIRYILQQICDFDPGKVILVGVSGGPDSLALLDTLARLGWRVVVAHMNHGLRPEAQADAAHVKQFASALGLPFVFAEENVSQFAARHQLSIEEAARTLRYRFLFAQAEAHQAQGVAVGHTADDQVETVLMHLLRGAGLAGLKGMPACALPNPWSDQIALARPMLDVWRAEVLDYCEERGLHPVIDQSNQDTTFFRNRLRHELIPILESYNPAVRRSFWRMARVLARDYEVIEHAVADGWQRTLQEQGPGYVALSVDALLAELPGLQRHLIRKGVSVLRPGLRDIDADLVERALSLLARHGSHDRADLGAGLVLLKEGQTAWLAAWEAALPNAGWPQLTGQDLGQDLALDVPGYVDLPDGWRLVAAPPSGASQALHLAAENGDPFQAWLDADALRFPLVIRRRQPGDRLKPLGMQGHSILLGDLMTNFKMPRRARANWPLVCSGSQIAWVPGLRLAESFRLTPGSQQAVHLRLMRQE